MTVALKGQNMDRKDQFSSTEDIGTYYRGQELGTFKTNSNLKVVLNRFMDKKYVLKSYRKQYRKHLESKGEYKRTKSHYRFQRQWSCSLIAINTPNENASNPTSNTESR